MARWLIEVREGERALIAGAFFTLLGLMAGHALIETARDTLFLQRLSPTVLPWVYLTVAGLSVVVAQIEHRVLVRYSGPLGLSGTALVGAACTLIFYALTSARAGHGTWVFYALYVFSATFSTMATVQFWTTLSGGFTVSDAKRVYAIVGAGSVGGALLGAIIARAIAHWTEGDARKLLLGSAVLFALASVVPVVSMRRLTKRRPRRKEREYGLRDNLPLLQQDPYLRHLAGLVLLSAMAFTLADYVFKSMAAAHVPRERLGHFFATTNIVFNVLALAMQLGAVSWLVRVLGVPRATSILPAIFGVGGGAMLLGGGFPAVLVLKAADGGLRHSLHRTTLELLGVPLSDSVRNRAKALMDGLGQRGGQAIGSLFILGALWVRYRIDFVLSVLLVCVAGIWLFTSLGMVTHYLELFRSALRKGSLERRSLPELDVQALERMITALNSDQDVEVLATLDLLEAQGRAQLIPALMLYHPARAVVLRTLDIFALSTRDDFVPVARRLLKSSDPEVRAAALGAIASVAPEQAQLDKLKEDPDASVRAAARVHAAACGRDSRGDDAELVRLATSDDPKVRLALARAVRLQPQPRFERMLLALAREGRALSGELGVELAWAMGALKSPSFVPVLMQMLAYVETMSPARDALVAVGSPALDALAAVLRDPGVPHRLRRHLPRTISRFGGARPGRILLEALATERDSVVRYKILRGLGALRARDVEIPLDEELMGRLVDSTLRDAFQMVHWRAELERGALADVSRRTPGHDFLRSLVGDKLDLALERLTRLLGLLHPSEELEHIHRGLISRDGAARAGSRELLEHLVDPRWRAAVAALTDELEDAERVARAGEHYVAEPLEYDALLAAMLRSESESIRCLAAYHAGEVGIETLRHELVVTASSADDSLGNVVERALAMLDARRARLQHA